MHGRSLKRGAAHLLEQVLSHDEAVTQHGVILQRNSRMGFAAGRQHPQQFQAVEQTVR